MLQMLRSKMLFHYGNCRKDIEDLQSILCKTKHALEDMRTENRLLATQLQEQKAIVDYTLIEKERVEGELRAQIEDLKKTPAVVVEALVTPKKTKKKKESDGRCDAGADGKRIEASA